MKTMKKVLTSMLVLVMAFALSIPAVAFAADGEDYSITITTSSESVSLDGSVNQAYKLFDVTTNGSGAYSYTPVAALEGYSYTVDGTTYNANAVETNGVNKLVAYLGTIASDSAALDAFAKDVAAYKVDGVPALSAVGTPAYDSAANNVVISNLSAGYFLVSSQFNVEGATESNSITGKYALVTLTKEDRSAEITIKADVPSIEKTIVEADATNGKATAADIGQSVTFQLKSNVPQMNGYSSYKYVVHDTMSNGLTYDNDSIDVTIDDNPVAESVGLEVAVDGQNITVTFANLVEQTPGAEIVITYSATLNENALTTANETNEVYLEYSNNPYDSSTTATTPTDKVYVYNFDIVIDKFAASEGNPKLAGASFVLKKTVEGATKYYKLDGNKATWVDSEDSPTVVTTDDTGFASFVGLDTGAYKLEETAAPDGYNLLGADVEVVITASYNDDGTLASSSADTSLTGGHRAFTQEVENSTGVLLPGTGGIGTTIFYIVGGILVCGAVVALIVRRRMSAR